MKCIVVSPDQSRKEVVVRRDDNSEPKIHCVALLPVPTDSAGFAKVDAAIEPISAVNLERWKDAGPFLVHDFVSDEAWRAVIILARLAASPAQSLTHMRFALVRKVDGQTQWFAVRPSSKPASPAQPPPPHGAAPPRPQPTGPPQPKGAAATRPSAAPLAVPRPSSRLKPGPIEVKQHPDHPDGAEVVALFHEKDDFDPDQSFSPADREWIENLEQSETSLAFPVNTTSENGHRRTDSVVLWARGHPKKISLVTYDSTQHRDHHMTSALLVPLPRDESKRVPRPDDDVRNRLASMFYLLPPDRRDAWLKKGPVTVYHQYKEDKSLLKAVGCELSILALENLRASRSKARRYLLVLHRTDTVKKEKVEDWYVWRDNAPPYRVVGRTPFPLYVVEENDPWGNHLLPDQSEDTIFINKGDTDERLEGKVRQELDYYSLKNAEPAVRAKIERPRLESSDGDDELHLSAMLPWLRGPPGWLAARSDPGPPPSSGSSTPAPGTALAQSATASAPQPPKRPHSPSSSSDPSKRSRTDRPTSETSGPSRGAPTTSPVSMLAPARPKRPSD